MYYKDILINNKPFQAFIDLGSTCTVIRQDVAEKLGMKVNKDKRSSLKGFGNNITISLGIIFLTLKIDNIEAEIEAAVV